MPRGPQFAAIDSNNRSPDGQWISLTRGASSIRPRGPSTRCCPDGASHTPGARRVASMSNVWEALAARGVLVRDVSSALGLSACLRVTIGRPADNDRFLTGLDAALQEEGR